MIPEMAKTQPLASAVYEGTIRHRRHFPHAHAFSYRIAFVLLDLAELDAVFAMHPLFKRERGALATFRRSDYLGDASVPLDAALRNRVFEELGRRPQGPIRLLTHLRYFGHCFNPVSFYYCYRTDGQTLDCIVAEITNTPWKERHSYVLDPAAASSRGSAQQWQFPKAFHVSPFIPMQRGYCWNLTAPGETLQVHMQVLEEARCQFDATLGLQRHPMSRAALSHLLWRYPAMTLRVVAAIHWQAFLTWCKRNPFYPHPIRHPKPRP